MPSISGPRPSESQGNQSKSTSPSESLAYLLQSHSPSRSRQDLDPRSMGVDRGIGAVLYALEAWKAQAAERTARTESKILLSLLALEQRIAQAIGDGPDEGFASRSAGGRWRGRGQYSPDPPDPKAPTTLEGVEQRLWELQGQSQETKMFLAERLAELSAKAEIQQDSMLRLTDLQEHMFNRLEKLRSRFETATRKADGTLERLVDRLDSLESRLSMEQNGLLEVIAAQAPGPEQSDALRQLIASNAAVVRALEELRAEVAGAEKARQASGRSPMALIRGGDGDDGAPPPTGQARSAE